MPKRSYPFDYYSHNSQTKVFVPDKEYLADVYGNGYSASIQMQLKLLE